MGDQKTPGGGAAASVAVLPTSATVIAMAEDLAAEALPGGFGEVRFKVVAGAVRYVNVTTTLHVGDEEPAVGQ